MSSNIEKTYKNKITFYSSQLVSVEKKISRISNMRLAVIIFTLVLLYLLFKNDYQIFFGILFLCGLALFIVLIIYHDKLFKRKNRLNNFIFINENGVKRVTDEWHSFKETGEEFINDDHSYTSDLDIFGNASLYQWINATHTFYGKHLLASTLRGESIHQEQIKQNQEAIRELASLLDFRQNIEEAGMSNQCAEDPKKIIDWLENDNKNIVSRKLEFIFNVLPYIAFLLLLSDIFLFKIIRASAALYVFQIILFAYYYNRTIKLFSIFENMSRVLNIYANIIEKIESISFSSQILQSLQKGLSNSEGLAASQAIADISKILEKAELRYNTLAHFILNFFWLWDIKCAIKATKWKKKNGKHIRRWLETIGHIEKLSSLSIIAFEQPSRSFPAVSSSETKIMIQNIRHPLISEKINIGNNFTLTRDKSIAIITGSNMSGKSTFLRTVAINLVLAYTGAPICANKMICGIFNIHTSMRTKDNLKGNVSTFFSELLRIKNIVDTVNTGKKTIFLIDEIFSGTNSQDRVTGAIAVLQALQLENAIGIISTHNLELCSLNISSGNKFINYHFREYYDNNDIRFDYKIYFGPSETRNAMFLIKMVGIPIKEGITGHPFVNQLTA